MKKRFKAKKARKMELLFIFFFIMAIVIISFKVLKKADPLFLLTEDYNLFSLKFDRRKLLLKNGLNYVWQETKPVEDTPVFQEEKIRKKIYVYNTHQAEEYADYDVLSAAKYLKEVLNNYGIEVIVEETDITAEVKKNNYTYSQSYRVTKQLLENVFSDDILLYIDLHRDSSAKSVTTTKINDLDYAKMMFVVGGKHENYQENYRTADDLNKMIKNISESLSRGLLLRKSSSYNQELGGNVILIELGGPYNTKEEVMRSIEALGNAINSYLEE